MGDGYSNKCKICTRSDNTLNRNSKKEYYIAYDKRRANLQHRVEARAIYAKTSNGKKAIRTSHSNYRKTYPLKRIATNAVSNAIRCGELIRPEKCSVCNINAKTEAHHDDYSKPLNIRWLCKRCHVAWHLLHKAINSD